MFFVSFLEQFIAGRPFYSKKNASALNFALQVDDEFRAYSTPLFFPEYSPVTLYLTDTDGAVVQYAGDFSAVNGFSFFGGNDFGGNGNTKKCL